MDTVIASQLGTLEQALKQAQALLNSGSYDAVIEQTREISAQFPNHPQVQFLEGVAQRQLGDNRASLKLLRSAAKAAPEAASVHYELALTLRAQRKSSEALRALRRATSLNPHFARAWQTLGEVLTDRGEHELADDAFREQMAATALHPGLNQAVKLVAEGKLGMAEGICRDYLYRYPTDVNAIRLLADIGLQLDIYHDAEKLLARCLELAPDYHLARNNYASALSKTGKYDQAMAELAKLESADPQNLSHPVLAASVLVNMGNYAGAIQRYQRVLAKVPGHSRLQMSLGHALKTVGRQDDCIDAYRRAIEAEPNLGEAYWSLANLKTFRFSSDDVATMKALVERDDIDVRDEFHLCFALGKALEDAGDYDDAFGYYERGNTLKRSASDWNVDNHQQQIADLTVSCTRERFAQRSGQGCPAPDPIFIVGLPRSGSTLLEQILASHSQVDGTMELPNILQFVRRLSGKKNKDDVSRYPDALWDLSAGQCRELGEEYLAATQVQRHGAPFFIDKMPNNFAHIGLIQLILPNAKIIDARRHPFATCFSCFKQLFAAGQEFTYGLNEIGSYYRDYSRIMAHWDAVLPGRVLRMDYERVIQDFEPQVRRLLGYCGLPFEVQCLAFYNTNRAVRTASSEQVRQPIYKDALEQWRHFEAHLTALTPLIGETVET